MNNKLDFEHSLLDDVHDALSPRVALRPRDEALADIADQRARCQTDRREVAARKSLNTLFLFAGAAGIAALVFGWDPIFTIPFIAAGTVVSAASVRAKTCTSTMVWSRAYAAILTGDEYDHFTPSGGADRRVTRSLRVWSALLFFAAALFAAIPSNSEGRWALLVFFGGPLGLVMFGNLGLILHFIRSPKKLDRIVDRAWDENPEAPVARNIDLARLQRDARAICEKAQNAGSGRGTSVSRR